MIKSEIFEMSTKRAFLLIYLRNDKIITNKKMKKDQIIKETNELKHKRL
jgi:hypothetical protein